MGAPPIVGEEPRSTRLRAVTSTSRPDDETLLARCRNGDASAWDQFVRRYERLVYSVAVRNGATAEDAADITQMTFVELLDHIDDLRDTERVASWLMTVARRIAWRTARREERFRREDAGAAESSDPIADWERLAWVHEAVLRLPDGQRELLLALYFDPRQPSYAEVASRLGHAIGTIGPMRARCLEQLRALLGEEE
jgi:RNA polymerase sigma factor (sigma-70 family)